MILRSEPARAEDWTVVAVGAAVLALPAEAGRLDDLTARLAGDDGFRAALEGLLAGGIAAVPAFALVDVSAGVRVVLRGDAAVTAGAETVSGADVTTWTERVLATAGPLTLRVPGSTWTIDAAAGALPAVPTAAASSDAAEAPAEETTHITLAPPREEPVAEEPVTEEPAVEESAPLEIGDPPAPEPHEFLFGDHDGRTVLVEDLEAHEQGELPAAAPSAAPALALELPDGALEPITAPLLVGRSPSDPGHDASGGTPRLVTIAADDKDISRTHARIEVAGGAVVVTDLDSKNGTSVTLPGTPPQRLRAGEPAVVLPDTVIDLGGGVVLAVREVA